MNMTGEEALRAGLLDRIAQCTCAVLPSNSRPCPFCQSKAEKPKDHGTLRDAPPPSGRPATDAPATGNINDPDGLEPGAKWKAIRDEANNRAKPQPKRREQPELAETAVVVKRLHDAGITFAGSLNGVRTSPAQAGKAKAAGMVAGEPDLHVYGHPTRPTAAVILDAAAQLRELVGQAPAAVEAVIRWLEQGAPSGVSLEMKTPGEAKTLRDADPLAGAEDHQRARLLLIEAEAGFVPMVGYGAADAIERLKAEGYKLP